MHLNEIHSSADVRRVPEKELDVLAAEMRQRIIDVVSQNGGHLASNLGVVELTIALHRAFDLPKDQIVFDVGHQCYAHKLLSGRQNEFSTLRRFEGMAGFPRREESDCDAFDTGHASTAISAAVGLARARDLEGKHNQVVAVVGDGALTGGMCYEALNDAGSSKLRLIVVLNDNGMSISPNVGSVSRYLTRMRAGKGWFEAKRAISGFMQKIPGIGMPLYRLSRRIKRHIRNVFVPDRLFDAFGFQYLGPVDGSDIQELERLFERAKQLDEPVLIHVVTQKGRGYAKAEDHPTRLHGTPPFDVDTGEPLEKGGPSMGAAAAEELCRMAEKDPNIAVITAAMMTGTGMTAFARKFPDRLYDVGIAEEHAVTMAAGLAAGGAKPFVAIYDTFMQRAYDQLLHDVCLQKLPVVFLVDRAGLSEDGTTHQGVYGLSYFSTLPNMTVLQPVSCIELRSMIRWAVKQERPVVIRYGKADRTEQKEEDCGTFGPWKWLRKGNGPTILCVGDICHEVMKAADILSREGIACSVARAAKVIPYDENLLKEITGPIITVEEGTLSGGFGSAVCADLAMRNKRLPILRIGLHDACTTQGCRDKQLAAYSLDAQGIARQIREWRTSL